VTLVEFDAYSEAIERLVTELDLHPVLVDVGASGSPPTLWNKISPHSIYVGFDPDLREMSEPSEGTFHKSFVVNKAVIGEDAPDEVTFFLTRFALCSSTLSPDHEALSSYLFADLFDVEREVKVQATTLSKAMDRLSLNEIDWLKLDSQGTDLRLFTSLRRDIRSKVVTLDIEPGLIDAYREEDLFVDPTAN
jgi:FkbM family methyltransferase